MEKFSNSENGDIVLKLADAIIANTGLLSEIDGAVADGDHGINMNKGFSICKDRLQGTAFSFSEGLQTLGTILLTEIGGSMGPLYGSLFRGMAKPAKGIESIDLGCFDTMLSNALEKVGSIGNAQVGDKTMMDTLVPAVHAFHDAAAQGLSFSEALAHMSAAAKNGMESTKDMVAKIGRAARLGERSRGVLDAGAVSCWIILSTFSEEIAKRL
jgi:dihydroxyacetone kinase-like protein